MEGTGLQPPVVPIVGAIERICHNMLMTSDGIIEKSQRLNVRENRLSVKLPEFFCLI